MGKVPVGWGMAQRATWRVTDDGDLDLTSAQRGIVRGAEAVRACAIVALRTRGSDWKADLTCGPRDDLITGRLAFLGQAETEYRRVILSVQGIETATVRRARVVHRKAYFTAEAALDRDNGGGTLTLPFTI